MSFIITFEHALGKAVERVKALALNELPKVQEAVATAEKVVPVAEEIATAIDPKAAPTIIAVGQASNAALAKLSAVLADEAAFQQALKTGNVTVKMATDEISGIKELEPALVNVLHAMGLGHTVPAAAASGSALAASTTKS